METSDKIDLIVPAYVKAQAAIGRAEKDGRNDHLGSRYSTLDAVWSAAKPALAANGLAVIQTPTIEDGRVVCVTRLMHTSTQFFEQTMSLPFTPKGNVLQAAGGAMTYVKRYSLLAMLGIGGDASDDNDGESSGHGKPAPKAHPGHHPSWTDAESTSFKLALLKHMNLTHDELLAYRVAHKKPAPSAMTRPARQELYRLLEAGELDDVREWLGKMADEAKAKAAE